MKQLIPALFTTGAVMALTGAAVYITGWPFAPYIYIVGAILVVLAQIGTPVKRDTTVLRRLRAQQLIGAILLVAAGVLMLATRGNEWIVCLTIAAILELYTSFRIPQEEGKDES